MQIRIEGSDLPGGSCGPSPDSPFGYHNIHVGVQRRGRPGELLGLMPGDAPSSAVPPDVLDRAVDLGLPVGRLGLTDPKGNPRCAPVRPPVIEWSAAPGPG